MSAVRRKTAGRIVVRQVADAKLRTIEEWRCSEGHDFGYDPDKGGCPPQHCPYVAGMAANGRWLGCGGAVKRVRKAGTVTE